MSRSMSCRHVLSKALVAVWALLAAPSASFSAEQPPILGVKVDGRDAQGFLANLAQFESWFGRQTPAVQAFTGAANWTDYEGSVSWSIGIWSKVDRTILWSVPLIPSKTTGDQKATLADAGKGLYNEHYKVVAQKLARYRPNEPVLYVRTGWEFNGGWFPWTVHGGKGDDFIAAYRQFVTTFRSVSPRFRFDWCPTWGDQVWAGGKPVPLAEFYPGDEYVDVIGLTTYDEKKYTKIEDPVKRWQYYLKRGHGLNWHRTFAAKHNKPMAYPEWGTGDAGDDPYFVEQFYKWVKENNVVYQIYWNSNSGYPGRLSTDKYPEAGAKYKELFGKDAPVKPKRPELTIGS